MLASLFCVVLELRRKGGEAELIKKQIRLSLIHLIFAL